MEALILVLVSFNLITTIWVLWLLDIFGNKITTEISYAINEIYSTQSVITDIAESLEIYEEEGEEDEEPINNVIEQKEVK